MKRFRDVVSQCEKMCGNCSMLTCPKLHMDKYLYFDTDLGDKVNTEALLAIKDVSAAYSGVLFLFTAVNAYACNLPEVCAVVGVTEDALPAIEDMYDVALEKYVTSYGVKYDEMTMVLAEDFDVSWLESDETVLFAYNGKLVIRNM